MRYRTTSNLSPPPVCERREFKVSSVGGGAVARFNGSSKVHITIAQALSSLELNLHTPAPLSALTSLHTLAHCTCGLNALYHPHTAFSRIPGRHSSISSGLTAGSPLCGLFTLAKSSHGGSQRRQPLNISCLPRQDSSSVPRPGHPSRRLCNPSPAAAYATNNSPFLHARVVAWHHTLDPDDPLRRAGKSCNSLLDLHTYSQP